MTTGENFLKARSTNVLTAASFFALLFAIGLYAWPTTNVDDSNEVSVKFLYLVWVLVVVNIVVLIWRSKMPKYDYIVTDTLLKIPQISYFMWSGVYLEVPLKDIVDVTCTSGPNDEPGSDWKLYVKVRRSVLKGRSLKYSIVGVNVSSKKSSNNYVVFYSPCSKSEGIRFEQVMKQKIVQAS